MRESLRGSVQRLVSRWSHADVERVLWAAKVGELDEQALVKALYPLVQRQAAGVFHSWRAKLPPFISEEDILQEMLMFLPRFARAYDPERSHGFSHGRMVQSNLVNKAGKAVHRWRNAKRSGGKGAISAAYNPSRFELAIDPKDIENHLGRAEVVDPLARLHAKRLISYEAHNREAASRLVLFAIRDSEGSIVSAARILQQDRRARRCGIHTEVDARRAVVRVLRTLGSLEEFERRAAMNVVLGAEE